MAAHKRPYKGWLDSNVLSISLEILMHCGNDEFPGLGSAVPDKNANAFAHSNKTSSQLLQFTHSRLNYSLGEKEQPDQPQIACASLILSNNVFKCFCVCPGLLAIMQTVMMLWVFLPNDVSRLPLELVPLNHNFLRGL